MNRTRRLVIAITAFAVTAGLGGALIAYGSSGNNPNVPVMPATGHPALEADGRTVGPEVGATGMPEEVARGADGAAFARVDGDDQRQCFAFGRHISAGRVEAETVGCLAKGDTLSSQDPIVDGTQLIVNGSTGQVKLLSLRGFAADNVMRVGYVDEQGTEHFTPIQRGVYYARFSPPVVATEVFAQDNYGQKVWTDDLRRVGAQLSAREDAMSRKTR